MQKSNPSGRRKTILSVLILSALLLTALVIGIVAAGNRQPKEDPQEYYNAKCRSYEVQNTNLAKGQIVFIGDSITDLYILDEHYADLPLASYNRGIGGDTTTGLMNRLQVSVFDIEPACVVLMIGTNDVIGGVREEEILANYEEIIDRIYTALPDVHLFCMSIIPMNRQIEGPALPDVAAATEIICRLNPQIRRLAEEKGAVYLDLFAQLADENRFLISDYSDDGLHLNRNGLLVWTKLLKPCLAQGNGA